MIRNIVPFSKGGYWNGQTMPEQTGAVEGRERQQRSDAQRNQQTILDAAAALFVRQGVDVPVRDIATHAGVGIGTFYRHFPTRSDLVVAVYRHQVDACAAAGPALLASEPAPLDALRAWVDLFVDFLVTKHGLAAALQSDSSGLEALHNFFLERLVPVCAELLDSAVRAGEISTSLTAYELMHGIGNLCITRGNEDDYDPRKLVAVLLHGLERA